MAQTIVSSTVTVKLYGAYKCSRCGETVKFEKIVNSFSQVTTGGKVYNQDKLAPLREEANQEASRHLGPVVYKELTAVENKDYENAYLHCSCSCGNKEAWARFIPSMRALAVERPYLFKTIYYFLFFGGLLSLIMMIASIIDGEFVPFILIASFWVCILLFALPIRKSINKNLTDKCLWLPLENCPHLFLSENDRDNYIEKELNHTYYPSHTIVHNASNIRENATEKVRSNGTISENNPLSDDTLNYCYKCGKKLAPDSNFCGYCGTKLKKTF